MLEATRIDVVAYGRQSDMKTYILKEKDIPQYYSFVLKTSSTVEEAELKIAILGLQQYDLEEAKLKAEIGDCFLVEYCGKLVPFQMVEREMSADAEGKPKAEVILQSYYLLEKRRFDKQTNVWRDCELRQYLNSSEFLEKFSKEFAASLKPTEIHTDDYVTTDTVWIPSHEEIGYVDKSKMFKPNIGAKCYEYYKS